MKKRLIAFSGYALFWITFFFAARIFFILIHNKEAFQFSLGTLAATFSHGIKLDVSATGYLFLIPVLISIPGLWFNGSWSGIFIKWYTWLFIIISSVIVVGDAVLYKYWGFRLDQTVIMYLKTPKEAVASAGTLEYVLVPMAIILISIAFIYIYNISVNRLFSGFTRVRPVIPAILISILFLGSLIIPIRGGTGTAPVNAGTAYFNDNIFINHTAINVVWNFGSSLVNQKPAQNPYNYSDSESAETKLKSLFVDNGTTRKVLNTPRPNILLIVLESFGSSLIGPLGGDSLTTPGINRYAEKGILFSGMYASGNRTDKAMPAILSGYPAQPAVSIIKEPKKAQSLPSIVKVLSDSGYSSSFWYGGDINFANFNSYIISSGFRHVISSKNFDSKSNSSDWGVPDDVLFDALIDSMRNVEEPFFKVVLTLSSHEPFDIPMTPVFEGEDQYTKYRNSIYFADKSLTSFLDYASTTNWWKNTLVILVADHCRRNSSDVSVYDEEIFRIPMLWLGGALSVTGLKVDKYGSQTDIPITVLEQLGIRKEFPFGKNLLSDSSGSFAFYTFNEGFGFITDSSKYIYDHKLGKPVITEGPEADEDGILGKSFLQALYDDYLKR